MRSLITTAALALTLATCADRPDMMMDAEDPQAAEMTPRAALDRSASAPTMVEDARHALLLATLDKLIVEHPEAAGGRVNLEGIFGGAYRGETFTHGDVGFQRVVGSTPVERGTHTITFRDLALTANTEAIMSVGLLQAHANGRVQDHIYGVQLTQASDGTWSAELTYQGHFGGALSGTE